MKSMQTYVRASQAETLSKHGSFFSFCKNTFVEKAQDGVAYVYLGAGLFAPKASAGVILTELDLAYRKSIQLDCSENSKEAIIRRELINFESFYNYCTADTKAALSDYPDISEDDIDKVFAEEYDNYKFDF